MTLTVVVGSSGSGKTTFLNDVHKSHKCIYIRQYHNIRPYVPVSKIPNFDPVQLPFWNVYEAEGTATTIKAGGTMAGEFTAGLSGGQRKLLLFELVVQRVRAQSNLLICLDEPFAGVTDDFIPFILERLVELKNKHQILLVTNDHVEALTKMADNTLTVSAIDRTTVHINAREKVNREKAILALAVGENYVYSASWEDLKFFFDVEVASSGALMGVAVFTVFVFALFLATFWDSKSDSAALVLVGGNIIAYFCVQPYLLSLPDWRNFMAEEAEALLHASKSMNKALKSILTIVLVLIVSGLQFAVTNAVIDGLESSTFWVAMLFDSVNVTFPFICTGLYTKLPFQAVQVIGSLPFLLMIFFSTTFSPGSGVAGVKELRYLFTRFYMWCMIPDVKDDMDNCPESDEANLVYLILTALIGIVIFLIVMGILKIVHSGKKIRTSSKKNALKDSEFVELQIELFGDAVKDLQSTAHSTSKNPSSMHPNLLEL